MGPRSLSAIYTLRSIDIRGRLRIALALAAVTLASQTVLAAFPGANGRITFDREDVEVLSILPDGTGETNLTDNPADDDAAAWSPDGTRIAFSSDRDGNPDIWVMDAGGQNLAQVTSGPDDDDHPAWSPDGTRIVFQRGQSGDNDVWVVNVDGSGATNLTNDPGEDDEAPAWSPDGARIAFCSGGDVSVMNPDGTGRTNLTSGSGSNECNPNWSPDGTRIAFDSDADGDLEIVVMNADGSGQSQRTFNGEDDRKPAWSPDGTRIVFEASRGGDDQIHVIDAAGGNETAVTDASNPDDDREPDWQPLPLVATTTTVVTTTTTPVTTTTVPGGTPAEGRRLILKDKAGKPQKRGLVLVAKDPAIGRGAENDSAGDPVVHGGFLKVVSSSGDGFNTTYDLPADRWRYTGKRGRNKGYTLKGAGPIRTVVVKTGKTLKVVARGEALGHSLGADPRPVHVALGLGSAHYCFTFGGNPKFKAGKSYVATKAQAPGACAALVPACGDRRLEPGESCPTFEGPADGPAIAATSNFDGEPGVPPEEIEVEASEALVARTRVEIEFAPEATVAQVNAVLGQLGGDIVMMLANVPLLLVRIPDPGSLAGLEAAVAAANTDPKVRVSKGYLGGIDVLPGNFDPPSGADLTKIDHHLAVHAPAAWNARAAIDSLPLLLIGDSFGGGAPAPLGDADVVVLDPSDFASGNPEPLGHGYHVLGIVTGRFDAPPACPSVGTPAALRACTTGMFPSTAVLRAVDYQAALTNFGFEMRIVLRALVVGNVVVSTSINHCFTGMCNNPAQAGEEARQWILMVRGAGLENGMLHLTSAGNIPTGGPTDARFNSAFSAAALHPVILDFDGTSTIPNLANTLVVENVVNGPAPDFTPLCLAFDSKRRGHLSAIGDAVWSLTGAVTGAGNLGGTSMATPQVAGLATYLWAIAPNMSVAQLRDLLRLTTRPVVVGSAVNPPCDPGSTAPAPIIDAYAAVLALDEATLPTPASAPVRHALLDFDRDDDLDEDDLIAWRKGLIDSTTNALKEPTTPEFQRFDLNGDGYTGGASRRVPFDLDRVGSTQFGTSQFDQVAQDVEGVSVPFDETGLTDLEILCYYAYSDFYEGDEVLRRQLLGLKRCSRITLIVDFPSTIEPGLSETLRVSVGRDGPSGSQPVPNIHIELSPAGGTVIPESGTTNAQGEFTAQADLAPGSSSIEIIVQALTAPGGAVLAEEVVTAFGPCTDAPTALALDFGNGEPDPTVDGPTLQNGLDYRITVSGTYTVNSTQQWQNGVCKGAPAAGAGGPTGIDAEFFFAVPNGSALCGPDFVCCPNHTEKFQISLGGGFAHVEPVSLALSPAHVYEYLVQGQGAPVRFRIQESNNRGDDYGILDITVACAADTTTTTTTSTTSSSTTTTTASTTTSVSSTSTLPSTSTTTASTTSSTTTTTGLPVIPYARYAATGPDGPVVMLADEVVTETVDLGAVSLQLPPVTIDGLAPPDQFTSQTCYAHPGGTLDDCIDIQDRFGAAPLRVGNPVGVCVPELLPAVGVDAFKCYAATGSAPGVEVALNDEFQSQTVTVGAPELFCTPVAVDGGTLVNPIRYLVCYATAPLGAAGGPIQVANAFHPNPIQVDVGVATGLCVPAVRQAVGTCQLCGNGVLDGDEDCDDGGLLDGDGCSTVCRFELDCTCNGVPLSPPDEARCATLADCGGFCNVCTAGGGVCGCQ